MKEAEYKIGINIGKAGKKDRGITVYTRNLLTEMARIDNDSNIVFLHYPGSVPKENFGFGENAVFVPLPYSDGNGSIRTIVNEQCLNPIQQAQLRLDIVWHPHNRSQLFSPCVYACTMHDILPVARPDLAGKYLNSFTKKLLFLSRTLSAVNADVVITDSEFSRQEIIKYLKVNPEKVKAIHLGINRETFHKDTNPENWNRVKSEHNLPDSYLLCTGSYAPHKNLTTIIDAYAHSNLLSTNVGLVMVGPNDATGYRIGFQELAELVKRHDLSNRIKLLPSVPEVDLVTIYSHARIYAIASLYEGFGFTPLEAMACEIPVLASNATALPEVCGSAALYADASSSDSFTAIINLLNEQDSLRIEMVEKGKKQVEKYSWRKCARQTLDALKCAVISKRQKVRV